jgi:hypothetical protein
MMACSGQAFAQGESGHWRQILTLFFARRFKSMCKQALDELE